MRNLTVLKAASALCAAAVLLPSWAAPPDMSVVEYFHAATGHYFMTGSVDDQRVLASVPANAAFAPTGRSFAAWSAANVSRPDNAVAVARFFSPALASHVFTSKAADIALLRSLPATASGSGFVDEGIAFFALAPVANGCNAGQRAIFRSFNNRADGNHRYSNELALQAAMVNVGFADEAVAFCTTGVSTDAAVEKRAGTPRPSGQDITLSGTVSAFISVASFTVGTQPVDASTAQFEHGSALALVNGLAVTVEGVLISGVLRATEVKLPASTALADNEIKGFITAVGAAGTIFVNGSAVDVRAATVTGGTLAQLIVGAEVEVHGALVSGRFVATLVHLEQAAPVSVSPTAMGEAEIKGLITDFVSLANFIVSAQKIDASAAVIEDGTVASLINGATVEVHGNVVAGVIKATRVEIKRAAVTPPPATTPPSVNASFEATGAISSFVSISSFKVSGATINASAATFKDGTAADLVNGAVVEVKGTLTAGIVHATTVEIKSAPVVPPPVTPPPSAAVPFEATGVIASFVSISSFKVSGTSIDASAATFKDGTAADLVNGAVVEVKGTLTGGVVHAASVEIKSTPVPPSAGVEFEATGAISGFVSVSSFQLSGKTIDASAASFERGSATDLRNGVQVEVNGTLTAGIVHATRVRFER